MRTKENILLLDDDEVIIHAAPLLQGRFIHFEASFSMQLGQGRIHWCGGRQSYAHFWVSLFV